MPMMDLEDASCEEESEDEEYEYEYEEEEEAEDEDESDEEEDDDDDAARRFATEMITNRSNYRNPLHSEKCLKV